MSECTHANVEWHLKKGPLHNVWYMCQDCSARFVQEDQTQVAEQRAAAIGFLMPHDCLAAGEDMSEPCPLNAQFRAVFGIEGELLERPDSRFRAASGMEKGSRLVTALGRSMIQAGAPMTECEKHRLFYREGGTCEACGRMSDTLKSDEGSYHLLWDEGAGVLTATCTDHAWQWTGGKALTAAHAYADVPLCPRCVRAAGVVPVAVLEKLARPKTGENS